MPRPTLGARIALGLVAFVVALVLCEAIARMIFPAPPLATREPQLKLLFDPEVRYVMAPSQQGWIDDGLITVNALGFRGHDVAVPKPAGRFRIAVIGDSVTMGWGVADDETFSARLEHLLHERYPARNLDVVNLAVGGYDTRQEVTLLERFVARLQPDLVLVGFYTNDVPDSLEDAASGTRIEAKNPVAGQVMHINPTPTDWWNQQLRKSRAVYVAGRAFNRLRGSGEWGMSRFSMEIDMLEGRDSASLDRAWKVVAGQFERLRSTAEAGRFAVGIIALPCREAVMGQYPNAKYQTRVRSIAEPLGFKVIDPLPSLSGSRKGKDLYIPYDRNHPSAAGHELIAEAVLGALESDGLIATAAR